MTTTVDRHKAAELYTAMIRAQDELENAKDERYDGLASKYSALFTALDQEYAAKRDALTKQRFAELGLDPNLETKVKAAEDAYNDDNVPMVETDDDGEVLRCALSGDPILDGEERFLNDEDGRVILADKVPGPANAKREAA